MRNMCFDLSSLSDIAYIQKLGRLFYDLARFRSIFYGMLYTLLRHFKMGSKR